MNDEPKQDPVKLTPKQRKFADLYVGECNLNATRAAIAAGYSEKTAYSIAHENLRKPEIAVYVEKRLSEATLGKSEVLARLARIANGSVEDFLNDDGIFNFASAKRSGNLGLLKKLKRKSALKKPAWADGAEVPVDEAARDELLYEEVEFEMYSSHEALRDLGKYHKLFSDRVEVTGQDGGPLQTIELTVEEWRKQAAERRAEAEATVAKFSEQE